MATNGDNRTPDEVTADKEMNKALIVFTAQNQSILAIMQTVVAQETVVINAQIAYNARYSTLANSNKQWFYGTTSEGKKGKSRDFRVDNELRRLSVANEEATALLKKRKAELHEAMVKRDEAMQKWTTQKSDSGAIVELPQELLNLIKEFSAIQ